MFSSLAWRLSVRPFILVALLGSLSALGGESVEDTAPPSWPRLGGHFGLAVSLATFGPPGTVAIGRDYVQVGITPGITVKIDKHWAVDFEFIAFSRWDIATSASHTLVVVDPGVLYNFGPATAGLRLAMQVGQGIPLNYGLVPIVVVPIPLGRIAYFLEFDVPVFVSATAGNVQCNVTALFQTGFAF